MTSSATSSATLDTLLTGVAAASLPDRVLLEITGADRVRWLNGMVTNSIQSLEIGQGCYNFFLNAQGRIQADGTAYRLENSILLETDRTRLPALTALLERFIIMDDVVLTPFESMRCLLLAGPATQATLTSLGLSQPTSDLMEVAWRNRPVTVIHAHSPLIPRFHLWSDPATLSTLSSMLLIVHPDVLTQLRLLEGTPLYGTDIRDRDLPQETAQTRALHFSKGCYLGQEIVERIRSRGNVHRTLSGFLLEGTLPAPGTPLLAQNKAVGELTSAARIDLFTGPLQLALGYLRREAAGPITYERGTAIPTPLPHPIQPASNLRESESNPNA